MHIAPLITSPPMRTEPLTRECQRIILQFQLDSSSARRYGLAAWMGRLGSAGCPRNGQSGMELIAAMPREPLVEGRADHWMPERVAVIPFLEQTHSQSAVQRVEQDGGGHRRFQCRRARAQLAQRDLRSADGS